MLSTALSWIASQFAALMEWLLAIVLWAIGGLLGLLFSLLELMISWLPDVPEKPAIATDVLIPLFSTANYFLPIAEAFSLIALWIAVYGAIFVYKGVKLLRGGG